MKRLRIIGTSYGLPTYVSLKQNGDTLEVIGVRDNYVYAKLKDSNISISLNNGRYEICQPNEMIVEVSGYYQPTGSSWHAYVNFEAV